MKRVTIGLTEKIEVIGKEASKNLTARIDTGATTSSIDKKLAKELEWNSKKKITTIVKSASGTSTRSVVRGEVKIAGKELKGSFTIIDRSHMRFPVLIGQNILKRGEFLIDTCK